MKTLKAMSMIWCLILFQAITLQAQTTAFSYQGSLKDGGTPANGSFQMQFKLFDSLGGTGQIGSTIRDVPVTATSGVFSVRLDFGSNAFSGADRWLEIAVRRNAGEGYTTLSPREQIASSPYSVRTLSAAQADMALDSNKLGGVNASQYVTTTSGGNSFIKNGTTQQPTSNFNVSGNGTAGSLTVNGAASLGGIAPPAPAPAGQGRIYFDSASNKVKISENSGAFVNLVGAGGVSGSGTTNRIPFWSAGTILADSQITQSVNGVQLPNGVQLAAGAQGNQVQFGSPNGETGMSISGATGRADVRFDGTTLRLLAGPAGSPPSNGIAITSTIVQLPSGVQLAAGAQGNQVQFGSPNSETGMSISGAGGRADLRFDGTLKLVNGVGGVPPATNGIAITPAGNVGVGTTTPATKLHVLSSTSAIVGQSTSGSGVYGESAVSSLTAGGVYGKGTGSGSIGVIGEAHINNAVGVFGVSTSTSGVGVYARNLSTGRALFVEGDAGQSRAKGGLVKAMIYADGNGGIYRCYNGVTGSSTGNCGFTIIPFNFGVHRINFGFRVDDRFLSVTAQYGPGNIAPNNMGANFKFLDSTTVDVYTFDANGDENTYPWPFMIIVY